MEKINILTLGDENFNKYIYAMEYKNIDFIHTIASCKLTKSVKENLIRVGNKNNRKVKIYPHKKMKTMSFFNSVDWNKINPLSNSLIEKMSLCEAETLKMYERIHQLKPAAYENRKKHYYMSLRYFNHLLDNANINIFIRYSVPHMGYDNVIYNLCKLKGIKTYMIYFIHPNFYYFMDDYKNPFKDFKPINNRDFKFEIIKKTFNEYWNKNNLSYKPVVVPTGRSLIVQERRNRRYKKIIDYYNSKVNKSLDFSKPFIFIALHYQHEATTCPLAGAFVDQILMIEILSKTGLNIYVKEHPRISANRSIEYYKQILSLKNTHLIPTNYPVYDLIDKSFAVATCTGTAGWEAVLKGKPCLLFGSIHYQYAPYVYKIDSVDDCIKAVEKIKKLKINKNKIIAYLKGLEEYLFPQNYKLIAEEFNKILEAEYEE